jgi:hypothetical protein
MLFHPIIATAIRRDRKQPLRLDFVEPALLSLYMTD